MPSAVDLTIDKVLGDLSPLVFQPISVDPTESQLLARVGTVAAGNRKLTLTFSNSKPSRKTIKTGISYEFPLERTNADGETTASNVARFQSHFVIPENMTTSEREELAYVASQLIQNTIIYGYASDLDPMW